MASFNEWLHRRDEAFHQNRFNRAMDKMAGKQAFDAMANVEMVVRDLINMAGQITRIQDENIADAANNTLASIYSMEFTDPTQLEKALSLLSDIKDQVMKAPKGMPRREAGGLVTNIQKRLDNIKNKIEQTKLGMAGNYGAKHHKDFFSAFRGETDDRAAAARDFMRSANFKRSGKFGPERYEKDPNVLNLDDIQVMDFDNM